MVNPESD